jgi:hypothetical protein
VPAKKTRKSADGARYLLSADRKFRRLSLKKISARVKSARSKTRVRASAKAAAPSEPPARATQHSEHGNAPVALVLGGAVLFAVFVGVLWSSPTPLNATESVAPVVENVAPVVASPAVPEPPPVMKVEPAPPVVKVSPAPAPEAPKPVSRPVEPVKVRTEVAPVVAPAALKPAPVEVHQDVAATSIDTVTISGCLAHDGKSAWLKDTTGLDAPKARSWKSGFLKKRSPRIALVDGPANASAYDGRRVSVTGVLADREMRVSSISPIAGECEL